MLNENQKTKFEKIIIKYVDKKDIHPRTQIKDINIYKNKIMETLYANKVFTLSINKVLKLLPKKLYGDLNLLCEAFFDLNEEEWLELTIKFFDKFITNSGREWIPLNTVEEKKDEAVNIEEEISHIYEDLTILKETKILNQEKYSNLLDAGAFTTYIDEKGNTKPIKHLDAKQVSLIDKLHLLQNMIVDEFVTDFVENHSKSTSKDKMTILIDLMNYNKTVIEFKRTQFVNIDKFADELPNKEIEKNTIRAMRSEKRLVLVNEVWNNDIEEQYRCFIKKHLRKIGFRPGIILMNKNYKTLFEFLRTR
ncbi:hypothetical protein ESOMN_v1c01110 [Williamsoniiplasma somnilux]|uniref:Uncharacterized protein n=1 Tax=Williamsoniiplasma somnilux TaxID=215578 RepID=A0A2K8NY66_9MOLU|nr:hypothetical protein [Williamsoniiplasma somnilux]ATZ18496.1 hypothetical protein ESOMN_v1c01110 [Williamsoniiplasma somnilux]